MRRFSIFVACTAAACNLQPASFDVFLPDGATSRGETDAELDAGTQDDDAPPADASTSGATSDADETDDADPSSGSPDPAPDPEPDPEPPAPACGDGRVDEGEACDDANADDGDDCLSDCTLAACGDGFVYAGVEECDDGDRLAGDGCSHHCTIETAPPKRVFISSQTFTGAMGGLAGADAQCQALAAAAGLPGTFMAWLSDGQQAPAFRLSHAAVPYILVDGTPVAEHWADLVDGTLAHAIDRTESGGPPPLSDHVCGQTAVWSNVTMDGGNASVDAHCAGWTDSNAIQSHSGRYDLTGADWSASCFGGGAVCLWSAPIYCFEQ